MDGHPSFVADGVLVHNTATPWRLDGKGLGEVFEESVVSTTTWDLIREGFLADYTGVFFKAIDTGKVHKRMGEFRAEELGEAAMSEEGQVVIREVVEQYVQRTPGRRGVCFAVNIAHSKAIVEAFRAAGVSAEHADGEMPTEQRKAVIERVRRGETHVLVNCNLVSEGFDLPALEVCMIARPTASVVLHIQQCGRVLRPFDGKALAVFHDHAGNFERLGCPDDDRDYSLAGDGRPLGKKRRPLECWKCHRKFVPSVEHDGKCPSCGARPEDKPAPPPPQTPPEPKEQQEAIRDVEARTLDELRRPRGPGAEKVREAFLQFAVRDALLRGHDPKRALMVFKEKFQQNADFAMYLRAVNTLTEQLGAAKIQGARDEYLRQKDKRDRARAEREEHDRQAKARMAAAAKDLNGAQRVTAHRVMTGEQFDAALDGMFGAAARSSAPPATPEHRALGLDGAAHTDEIKSAYRRLAHEHHPDKGGSAERMAEINAAYEKLMARAQAPAGSGA